MVSPDLGVYFFGMGPNELFENVDKKIITESLICNRINSFFNRGRFLTLRESRVFLFTLQYSQTQFFWDRPLEEKRGH